MYVWKRRSVRRDITLRQTNNLYVFIVTTMPTGYTKL